MSCVKRTLVKECPPSKEGPLPTFGSISCIGSNATRMSTNSYTSRTPYVTDNGAHLQKVSMSLYISVYGIYMCWLACEDEDTQPRDLHMGLQRALDHSEDDVVAGDIASDSSDVDVGRAICMRTCCSLLGVHKQSWVLIQD